MGKLSSYKPQTTDVEVGGDQTITVRGLSITDIAGIMQEHATTLDSLYQQHIVSPQESAPPEINVLMRALMTEAPDAAASIIAYAAGEPEQAQTVSEMPGLDQIKLLMAISALTFHSEDELKKVMEGLIVAMQAITGAMNQLSGPTEEALPET